MSSISWNIFGMEYSTRYCMFFKGENEEKCASALKCLYILYSHIPLHKHVIYESALSIRNQAI